MLAALTTSLLATVIIATSCPSLPDGAVTLLATLVFGVTYLVGLTREQPPTEPR